MSSMAIESCRRHGHEVSDRTCGCANVSVRVGACAHAHAHVRVSHSESAAPWVCGYLTLGRRSWGTLPLSADLPLWMCRTAASPGRSLRSRGDSKDCLCPHTPARGEWRCRIWNRLGTFAAPTPAYCPSRGRLLMRPIPAPPPSAPWLHTPAFIMHTYVDACQHGSSSPNIILCFRVCEPCPHMCTSASRTRTPAEPEAGANASSGSTCPSAGHCARLANCNFVHTPGSPVQLPMHTKVISRAHHAYTH